MREFMHGGRTSFDLKDRAYIVTGAGRGIGAELAAGLAEAGACVAIAGRTAADCEKVAARSPPKADAPSRCRSMRATKRNARR